LGVTLREVEELALTLSAEERARLADMLLASLDGPEITVVEVAWEAEIAARIAAYRRGELETIPAEQVFAEARRLAE
jgi:putative addiction module component (TIGR02574 family)